jgi:hypothetical protein
MVDAPFSNAARAALVSKVRPGSQLSRPGADCAQAVWQLWVGGEHHILIFRRGRAGRRRRHISEVWCGRLFWNYMNKKEKTTTRRHFKTLTAPARVISLKVSANYILWCWG